MLRTKIGLISFLAIVFFAGAIALAAAVKVELQPYPPSAPIEMGASGHAILNYAKGQDKTIVEVNCWNLMPDSTYTVYLKAPAGFYSIGTFTTRGNGSGNLHVSLEGNHSEHLPVAVNNAANQTVLLGP